MPRIADRRGGGRRAADVKREMLEESLKELPSYLVTVLDDEKGLYSFYYASFDEAQRMVGTLTEEGISENLIAIYQRVQN